ncbi:FAS-associated factor 2 [Galendromus occidentalis]|uniref:FAS-associated factor 2 n=1 Tax=Galendromus occidentalis TaxID=34638 RepID=A0AAJ6QV85_9ACAR|nr:FAS-associated factor 2 [Galendromus occidentalis]
MAAPSGELTKSMQEKLVQFQDISGYEDLDRCREILAAHNWDLESAVATVFAEASPSVVRQQRSERLVATVNQDYRAADYVFTNFRPQGWIGFGLHVFRWPLAFFFRTFYNVARFAISLMRRNTMTSIANPEGDVRLFIKQFRDTYGAAAPFLETSYNQALSRAKTDLRFLLVYLHNPSHEDTDDFCRRVFCSESVISWINNNMLLWGCSVQLPEGHKVSRTLQERTYPFMCVIVLRENTMTVVARILGQLESSDQLISILETVKGDNEGSLRAARQKREVDLANQTIREQQNAAYEESLRADQEKARRRREAEELKRKEEEEAIRRAELEALEIERRQQEKLKLAAQVPDEPPQGHEGAIQLALRLPSGKRIDRRFLSEQSMKYLYFYVLCHTDAPDNFEIHTTYPRRKIPCEPVPPSDPPSFKEFGLARNESLMVTDSDA